MSQARRLGMGLGALIGGSTPDPAPVAPPAETSAAKTPTPASATLPPGSPYVKASGLPDTPSTMEINSIRPNPFQPRTEFDEKDIQSLSDSIKKQGLLQPVVVRQAGSGLFQLVAGERRWRASKLAGLARIPVIVRDVDDRKMLEFALVENLQRRDLNPMEKARAFRQLMSLNTWTQDQLSEAVAMSRPAVANFLRLLELPTEVQEAVSRGTISMGHARALLAIPQRAKQLNLVKKIVEQDLSVRAIEQLATNRPGHKTSKDAKKREPYLVELEQKLMDKVGTRVEIGTDAITIPFSNKEQLTMILRRLDIL